MSPPARKYVLALALAIITSGIFYGVLYHGFLFLDDGRYVEQNPRVLSGLSWPGVLWALKSTDLSNWHPLTWLSHITARAQLVCAGAADRGKITPINQRGDGTWVPSRVRV